MTSTMSITTFAELASAGVLHTVQLVGQVGGYAVFVRVGQTEKQLTSQRGEPGVFASLDTAAAKLLALGVLVFEVLPANYVRAPKVYRRGRPAALKELAKIQREGKPAKPAKKQAGAATVATVALVAVLDGRHTAKRVVGEMLCTQEVNYSLADQDHDAVSEDVLFCSRQAAQAYHKPRIAVLGSDCIAGDAGASSVTSTEFISVSGPVVTGCRQQLRLPTITRARLFEPMFVSRCIPPADHAFHVEC